MGCQESQALRWAKNPLEKSLQVTGQFVVIKTSCSLNSIIKVKEKSFLMECRFYDEVCVFVLPGNLWRQRISRSYWNNRGKGISLSVCCSIMCYILCTVLSHFGLKCQTYKKKIVGYFKCNWIAPSCGCFFSNVISILLSIHHTWIHSVICFFVCVSSGSKGWPWCPWCPWRGRVSHGSHTISKCLISLQSHHVAKGYTFYSISLADEVIIKYGSIYFNGEFIFL